MTLQDDVIADAMDRQLSSAMTNLARLRAMERIEERAAEKARPPMPTLFVDFPASFRVRSNRFKRDGLHIDFGKKLVRQNPETVDYADIGPNPFVSFVNKRHIPYAATCLDAVTRLERTLASPYWALPRTVLGYIAKCEAAGIKVFRPLGNDDDEWVIPIRQPLDKWQRAARKNCNRPRAGKPRGDKSLTWSDGEAKWNVIVFLERLGR